MIAIQIADYFVLKREPGKASVDVANMIIWVAGFAIYRYLMHVDMLLGNTLPDMIITIIICVVVRKIVKTK